MYVSSACRHAMLQDRSSGQDCLWVVQDRTDLASAMIAHLGTTSIAETLVRLIGADESPNSSSATSQQLVWVDQTDIMASLMAR